MKGLPLSMLHKIPADFRFLRSLGITGIVDNVSLQPSTAGLFDPRPGICVTDYWRYNVLNFLTFARFSWSADTDIDVFFEDFLRDYYGPAAKSMHAFWSLLEEATVKYGADPVFQPDDKASATPDRIHGWFQTVRDLIPNEVVFRKLERHLTQARYAAASGYAQPLKAEAMPYLDRVQLLERVLAVWPSTKSATQYLNR